MSIRRNCLVVLFALMTQFGMAGIFYSAGNGNWNNANTWSNTEGGAGGFGIPTGNDTVVVRSGDIVSIPHSYTTGSMPGSVPGHTSGGGNHFVFEGKLTVRSGGTLRKISSTRYVIFTGETDIFGTLSVSDRLYNLGDIIIHSGASASIGNDLVLADVSSTVIDVDLDAVDDIYFIGTNATLCGTGSVTLGTNSDALIQEFGADPVNQMCAGFPVYNDGAEGNTTYGENTSLPITLIVFNVVDDQLYWDVIEEDVWAFEVHYSENGSQWEKYGALKAHGSGRFQYSYHIKKAGFYRIMSVEEVPEFSPIVYYTGVPSTVNVFPNVAKANSVISIVGEEIHKLEFVNQSGQIVKTVTGEHKTIHLDLKPDLYFVRVYQPTSVSAKRLVIQ